MRLSTYVLFVDYGPNVEIQHTVRGTRMRVDRATYEDLLCFQGFAEPAERHAAWIDAGVLVPPFRDEPEYHGGLRHGTEAKLGHDYQAWYWEREVESERDYRWLGRTVLKMPSDLFFYQELIVTHGLRSVLEIGHGDGGGLWFFATVLSLLGGGHVVGVDRDGAERLPDLERLPGIVVSTERGDAHEQSTLERVRRLRPEGFGLVVIDADPTPGGKLALLERWEATAAEDGILVLEDVESPACTAGSELVRGIDRFLLGRRHYGLVSGTARTPLLKGRGAVLRRVGNKMGVAAAPQH